MANFTKISKYRLGAPRYGYDLAQEPANGPVVTYHLEPEEVARRFGPSVKGKSRIWRPKLSQELLERELSRLTVGQVAAKYAIAQQLIYKHVEQYGLELDEKNRLKADIPAKPRRDDMATKIDAASEALPRDEFLKLINQGLTDQEVADAKGLELYLVKRLKQKYELVGIVGVRNRHTMRKERENMDSQKQKMTVVEAIKFHDELLAEVDCVEDILRPDAELAPRTREILQKHFEECSGMVNRLRDVFGATEVEV